MDTSRTQKSRRNHFHNSPSIPPVEIREKVRLLKRASQERPCVTSELLYEILENTKELLLPLVYWFDKPIPHLFSSITNDCAKYRRYRAMVVVERWGGDNWLSVALDRRGTWFVRVYDAPPGEDVREMGTHELALLLLECLDQAAFQDRALEEEWECSFFEDGEASIMFKNIFRYEAAVQFIEQCQTTARKALCEPTERLRLMQERLDVLDDFCHALDPLQVRQEPLTLPGYAIWHEHSRGSDVTVQPYISREALGPFWKVIRTWHSPKGEKYYEKEYPHTFRRLEDFVDYVTRMLTAIHAVRATGDGCPQAQDCLHSGSARLPLTPEELSELSSCVRRIA